jgi:predicted DNA-binding transcriptional regulator YafY
MHENATAIGARQGGRDMNVIDAIRLAGQQCTLLCFMYDGEMHTVEPYSFRNKGGRMLFYGHCQKCGCINAFDPAKMSSVEVTDRPFDPRWPVEF